MRLLVCGGRHFGHTDSDYKFISNCIADALNWVAIEDDMDTWMPPVGTVIIHGKARGVDMCADMWAVIHWVPIEEYPADWEKYGKAAGAIRNQQMLDEGKPDKVLAIHGGKGTADMVRRAKKAGIPVIEVK